MAKDKTLHTDPGKTLDGLSYLTVDTMGDLDHGFARICIDEAIKKAATDLDQRGEDGKTRKVVITLTLKQINENDTKIDFHAEAKLPPLALNPTIAQRRGVGKGQSSFAFRPENPTRPDQPTIFKHPENTDNPEQEDDQ